MLKDMVKLRIVGPKGRMRKVIEELHALRILHIIEQEQEGVEIGKPLTDAEELSATLVKARAVATQLSIPLKGTRVAPKSELGKTLKTITKAAELVARENAKVREAEECLREETERAHLRESLAALGLSTEDMRDYASIITLVGSVKKAGELEQALERSLKEGHFLIKRGRRLKEELIAVFVDKEGLATAKTLLATHDFAPLDLAPLSKRSMSATKAKRQLKEAHTALQRLRKEHQRTLPGQERLLVEALTQAEAPLRFGETERAFLIWGFVPKERLKEATDALLARTKRRILIETHPIVKDDKVPVELKNPPMVKSFQFFLDLYALPKYKEIDPSSFLFLTFPLLFGFMLGDMGYGLVTLVIFWLLKKRMPQFKDFFNILIFSSLATIYFGAIFAEFFGLEPWHPLISRNPEHTLTPLMIMAIVAGIIHINAGLITGFVNEYKAHGFVRAFLEKAGWILLQVAAALLGLSYAKMVAFPPLVGYAVLGLTVLILFLGEGTKGLVEIPSIFGNILSYMRLMAIGLSSVGLALVINDMASGFFKAGWLGIIGGVLILVVGHVVNIGIGCLGSFLHSLRLHYVELFSKFYTGGGIMFKPFGIPKEE